MGSIFRDLVRQVSFKGCRAFQLICCLTGLCTQLHTLPAPHNSSQNNQCYRGSSSCNQSKCFCLHFSPLSVYFELDCDFGLVELARQHHMNAYRLPQAQHSRPSLPLHTQTHLSVSHNQQRYSRPSQRLIFLGAPAGRRSGVVERHQTSSASCRPDCRNIHATLRHLPGPAGALTRLHRRSSARIHLSPSHRCLHSGASRGAPNAAHVPAHLRRCPQDRAAGGRVLHRGRAGGGGAGVQSVNVATGAPSDGVLPPPTRRLSSTFCTHRAAALRHASVLHGSLDQSPLQDLRRSRRRIGSAALHIAGGVALCGGHAAVPHHC